MAGLIGFVENLDDGRVRIIIEGENEKLKWFESAPEFQLTIPFIFKGRGLPRIFRCRLRKRGRYARPGPARVRAAARGGAAAERLGGLMLSANFIALRFWVC